MKSRENSGNSTVIGLVIVVVVLLIGAGVWNYSRKPEVTIIEENPSFPSSSTTTPITETPTITPADVKNPPVGVLKYKDGTYSAVGNYVSPGGAESIDITLVIKDDNIIEATAVSKAERPQSKNFQNIFVKNFSPLVIGKKIDVVNLSRVSGSSLTPKGFNDAVIKIKAEAKA